MSQVIEAGGLQFSPPTPKHLTTHHRRRHHCPPPPAMNAVPPLWGEVVDVWIHGPSSACASIWCIREWAFELDRNYSNEFPFWLKAFRQLRMKNERREQRSIVQMWLIWNRIWIIVFKYLVNLSKKPETIHLNWISPQEFGLTVITFNVKRNI